MRKQSNNKPRVYMTDHVHSRVVCASAAVGCGGQIVETTELLPGPAVVWGVLRGCNEVICKAVWAQHPFYHIDNGYFLRGHYGGYYRVTPNGLSVSDAFDRFVYPPIDRSRWCRIKKSVDLYPLNRNGRNVIVCGPTTMFSEHFPWLKLDHEGWIREVVKELSYYTDRPIVVKKKYEGQLRDFLTDAYCVVVHSSNAATEALRYGVPVIALGPSVADCMGWGYDSLEQPDYHDFEAKRERLFEILAAYQWTLEELRTPEPWKFLGVL
jgi:hypothetical protein